MTSFILIPSLNEALQHPRRTLNHGQKHASRHPPGAVGLLARRGGVSRLSRPLPSDNNRPRRPSRVAEQIRRDLAEIFLLERVSVEEAEDEQLVSPGFSTRDISVLEVSISPDLKTARVDVSVLGGETTIKSCITWLTRHRWEIRRFLAQKMRNQKRVPELHFRESRVPQVMRTLQLIEKLAAERRERSSVSNQDRIDTAHETADRELDVDAEIRAEDLFLLTPPATSDPEASP